MKTTLLDAKLVRVCVTQEEVLTLFNLYFKFFIVLNNQRVEKKLITSRKILILVWSGLRVNLAWMLVVSK
jgi:hypothetical protein